MPSSVCPIFPQTSNQVYNSVCGRTPLTVEDNVESDHLPLNQVDLQSMLPMRNLAEDFVAVELIESITTPDEHPSTSQNIQ